MNKTAAGNVPGPTIRITLGTAGHIDHGKTSLVHVLTGCNTDRLPEEQARGMTIDLGFAPLVLPDGRRVGIVDVPGHERFIRNMVAGAVGMDLVMLVVAADDGVMPQTIEHFHIVRLLGVTRGLVALTKIDLAEPARIEEVKAQVRALLAGSPLQDLAIAPISTKTGAGFDGFYSALVQAVGQVAEHEVAGPFRLPVERSFALKGLGTVISGIPRSGTVGKNDTLVLLPKGQEARVRSLQVYGAGAESAGAGACVALNLPDLSPADAPRGTVLATPGYFTPTRFVDVHFFHLPGQKKPLKSRVAIKLHIGTNEVEGHLMLPDLTPLPPGADTYVQLQLETPVIVAPGDRFIVRLPAPPITIGGGYVVSADQMRMRRTRGDWREKCANREEAFQEPLTALLFVLQAADGRALDFQELAARALVEHTAARGLLAELVQKDLVVALPHDRFIHRDAAEKTGEAAAQGLRALHQAAPLKMGFTRREIGAAWQGDAELLPMALDRLQNQGRLLHTPAGYALPEFAPQLTPAQQQVAEKLILLYKKTGYASPRRDELPGLLKIDPATLAPVFEHLCQRGDLVVVSDKVVLHQVHLARARGLMEQYIRNQGALETNAFKDLLQTTRKYAIAILEYWDRQRVTRRIGDARKLWAGG